MSRCFPYPPPGYCRNGATHDALIESIKLQKETKTKTERKKEKKAKKEEKKRLKEKRNNEISYNLTEAQIKKTKSITELFENSDLTEEHGQAITPHQPSYSSDSTQNSNKRKRDNYSLIPDNSTGNGSFKIRFLKKQKASISTDLVADVKSNTRIPVPSSSNLDRKNGVPATFGIENRIQNNSNSTFEATMIGDQNRLHSGLNVTSTSAANGGHMKEKEDPKKVGPTRSEKKILKKQAKYEKLIGRWIPPVLQSDLPDDDWLSNGNAMNSSISKSGVETCRESIASWQPCARFLAEVDIHALPYTVPF